MDLSILLSRDLLGLPESPLSINDHVNYYVSELGDSQVSWRRQTTSSPWVDGTVTTHRSKENITRNLSVEVLGATMADAASNAKTLIDAISQDYFDISIGIDDALTIYRCEASDYSWVQAKERWHASRGVLTISLIHKPNPQLGDV